MTEGKKKLTAEDLEILWQNVGLANDLMFRFVMENPSLCRKTLSLLLGKQVGVITEQQTQFSIEIDGRTKGIRLDLYVEVEGEMIDVEIQTVKLSKKEMGHRLRFYQSELDQLGISKGLKYKELKKSIIIFICTYDPFGKGAGRYTFEETCQEESNLILDDGATKIIYNTLGTLPESDKNKTAIENFFNYVNGEQPQDDFCKELAEEVKKQHQSTKKKGDFLMWEQIICEREEAAAKEAAKIAATEKSEKMAIKMLKGNEPVTKIAEYTELALSKIQELANKNGYTLVAE